MINDYEITPIPDGWEFRFTADNRKTGHGSKFYTYESARDWCMNQTTI